MRALSITILAASVAVLLIIYGILLLGTTVSFWRTGSSAGVDIDTQQAALRTDLLTTPTAAPLLAGMENGSMTLGGAQPAAAAFAAGSVPADEPIVTILPITPAATVDPCPPQAEGGFPADATAVAVGSLRLYSEPDLFSAPLGEFGAGQAFLITADTGGVTAVRRCELVWVRVRLTGGSMGWVLASAVNIGQPTVGPTVQPTVTSVVTPPICPGGCGTPTPCWNPCSNPCPQPPQPCGNPCPQPCNNPCNGPCGQPYAQQQSMQPYAQPCPQPCGVYSQ